MKMPKRRSRWVRLLRGVGWTLLGILTVLVILAILGMTISPQRSTKTRSLENEDFGLGFKVGDKWDPAAFDAVLQQKGINFTWDKKHDISSPGFLSASWDGDRGFLSLQVIANPNNGLAYVNNVFLSVYVPFELDKTKSLLGNYGIAARAAAVLYLRIRTSENIRMGFHEESVVETYGKPLIRMTTNEEGNGPYLVYATDRQLVSFCFTDGQLSSMDAMAPTKSKYLNRLAAWGYFMASPLIEAMSNRQLENTSTPVDPNFRPDTNGTVTDG